ncbi:MAG TPA: hypothetical protein VFF64_16490 [Candidatus Eremiobacteraceae bacterium]|nr:hypothetical protein [Candidatus Eremiobacteraceae bacterium]
MSRSISLLALVLLSAAYSSAQQDSDDLFRFAVSGDSRNCGDIVMPAIAKSALDHHADFYWHLGDFRMMGSESRGGYKAIVDEDMCQEFNHKPCGDKPAVGELSPQQYRKIAWGDFIAHQVAPFGTLPVFLGIGNHEMYKYGDSDPNGDKSHADFVAEFAYWLYRPEIATAPAAENVAYYHWKKPPVDFVYLDNSRETGFDNEQLQWLREVLETDRTDGQILSVVVGMHRALPNSLACGHSMNGDSPRTGDPPDVQKEREKLNAQSLQNGLEAYKALHKWKKETRKLVYILASHSHFYMANIFDTGYWQNPHNDGSVLPGWLVGTAGARRYVLPPELEKRPNVLAKTYTYGYLLGSVRKDGSIGFQFEELTERDVPDATVQSFGKDFVQFCFYANRDSTCHEPPKSCGYSEPLCKQTTTK